MLLPLFMLLAIAVFVTQLFFCFCAKHIWIKWMPFCLAAGFDILCWLIYFSGSLSDIYGGDFAAYIYGIVLLCYTVVAGFGWGIYGIVKLIQKRRK